MKKLTIFLLCLLAASPTVFAQILTFSGGNGTPLTITLAQPVTFTITTAAGESQAPDFVIQDAGNLVQGIGTGVTVSGSMDFTINNGTPQAINNIFGGVSHADLHSVDDYLWGALPGVSVGDVVTLNAGSLTTGISIIVAPPADGTYSMILTNTFAQQISSNGKAAPEPSTWALFSLGLLSAGLVARYRRQGHALLCR